MKPAPADDPDAGLERDEAAWRAFLKALAGKARPKRRRKRHGVPRTGHGRR